MNMPLEYHYKTLEGVGFVDFNNPSPNEEALLNVIKSLTERVDAAIEMIHASDRTARKEGTRVDEALNVIHALRAELNASLARGQSVKENVLGIGKNLARLEYDLCNPAFDTLKKAMKRLELEESRGDMLLHRMQEVEKDILKLDEARKNEVGRLDTAKQHGQLIKAARRVADLLVHFRWQLQHEELEGEAIESHLCRITALLMYALEGKPQ